MTCFLFTLGRDVDDLCLWDADGREMDWTAAVDVCDKWGGSLLRIMSPDEQDIFTTNYMSVFVNLFNSCSRTDEKAYMLHKH